MSGCSYDEKCPECGANMSCYSDYKPHNFVSGDCTECGFYYRTVDGQMTLEEVNHIRVEILDWEPLERLPQEAQNRLMKQARKD